MALITALSLVHTLLWPRPLLVPLPLWRGERSTMCGLPLVQQCWCGEWSEGVDWGQGGDLGHAPSRQTAVEPRHGQPGLFGWHTISTSAKEVWPLKHSLHVRTHTHTHTHTHTPLPSSPPRSSSLPTLLMPWPYTSPPGSPPCPSPLDTPTSHWNSSPYWSRLSESLSGWEETSPDKCPTTLHGSSPPKGATLSGEGEGRLGNCKVQGISCHGNQGL